jgi:predicted HNH restriction endonuclease
MSIETKICNNPDVAVFSKNDPVYLKESAEITKKHPNRLITFRSAIPWKTAKFALSVIKNIPIYFAVEGGRSKIEYQATLQRVYLHPRLNNKDTKQLLSYCLDSTKDEGLWKDFGKQVNTLYSIRQCRKLEKPFSMTALIKVANDKHINEDFKYSYSIVYAYSAIPDSEIETYPEEVVNGEQYYEGTTRKVTVNVYERNRDARKKCLAHYGYACIVCEKELKNEYGSIGENFIHVHHLKPLSKINKSYKIDPIADLRPICPNCHAMIHKKESEPYFFLINELKKIRKNAKQMNHD